MCNRQKGLFSEKKFILVIGQEAHIGENVLSILSQEPTYYTILVACPTDAFHVAAVLKISLFLIDEHLSSMEGLDLYDCLRCMKGQQDAPAILLCTALGQHEARLKERNISGIQKPFDADDLLDLVARTLASSRPSQSNGMSGF